MSGIQTLFQNPEHIPFIIVVLIIAAAFHEFAHAATAVAFGDPTPRDQGRLTLDPRPHLDLVGTILFVLIGFGWAKPVETNPSNYRYPRQMDMIVSLAGPLMNLLLAFLTLSFMAWYTSSDFRMGLDEGTDAAFSLFLFLMLKYNLIWFLLNLLPVPPFDGYQVLRGFLNPIQRLRIKEYEQYGMFIFFAIILIDPLYDMTLGPYFALSSDIIQWFGGFLQ